MKAKHRHTKFMVRTERNPYSFYRTCRVIIPTRHFSRLLKAINRMPGYSYKELVTKHNFLKDYAGRHRIRDYAITIMKTPPKNRRFFLRTLHLR